MHKFVALVRTCAKHAAPVLALGALLQLASLRAPAQNTPKRPRITGIDHIRLYVSDLGRSREFYRNAIGIPERGSECSANVAACFTIFETHRQAIELERAPSSKPKNSLAEIALTTDNASQMRRYLMEHGVKCGQIFRSKSGSSRFQSTDPEGNVIAFVQSSLAIDDPPFFPANEVGTRLIHAGFVVKDVEVENKFYIDLLGFKLYWQGGFKDDGLDWYEIQVPDGPDWIEYMLNIPANADHKELGVQNHFSLGVRDIHAAADQLHKNGIAKFDGPEIGRDGKWGLDAYDPDGTRVEVMEFTPAREPCCHPYTAPHPQP